MSLDTAHSTDIEQRPFGIEQACLFFQTPREIRDLIYEQVFVRGKSEDGALNPLATCRQFYNEALFIAWSLVTFRFDWSNIAHKYFSHPWTPPFPVDEKLLHRSVFSLQQTALPEPKATDHVYSGLTPADFTIRAMATRAGLNAQHIGAIRNIRVAIFMGHPEVHSTFTNFWILCHFLQSLQQVPGTSNFGQLERLTLERECGSLMSNLMDDFRKTMSVLWASNITKRIVTSFPYSIHQSEALGCLWSEQEKDRIQFAAEAHHGQYGRKPFQDAEPQPFDIWERDMTSEWRYHCMTEDRPGFRMVRYIEVVKYGETSTSDLEDEYWVDMQGTTVNGQSINPLVILPSHEALRTEHRM
jgi:hypothetical protein